MIRTYIVDDDKPNIDLIRTMADRYCPELQIIGSSDQVETAISEILQLQPDLIYLDIQLHNQSGFEILDAVKDLASKVIIVSAYEQYALKAIKNNVTDYLVKPIRIADYRNAVTKVAAELKNKNHTLGKDPEKTFYIALPEKNDLSIISSEHIVRLEARSNYTRIITDDSGVYTTSKTLKDYEIKLPPEQFIRVHKSHIVNLQHVCNYQRLKNGHLIMNDSAEIPIAASRKKEVLQRILF